MLAFRGALGVGTGMSVFPVLFGATSMLASAVSVGLKGVIVWGSAKAGGHMRDTGRHAEEPWA